MDRWNLGQKNRNLKENFIPVVMRSLLTGSFLILILGILSAQNTLSDLCTDCRFQARATGNTNGLVFALRIDNTAPETQRFTIPYIYIPVGNGFQPVAVPDPVEVELSPGTGIWFDITGYCMDITLPPPTPATELKPGQWIMDLTSIFPVIKMQYSFYSLLQTGSFPPVIHDNPALFDQVIQHAIWLYQSEQHNDNYGPGIFQEKFEDAAMDLELTEIQVEKLGATIWEAVNKTSDYAASLPDLDTYLTGISYYDQHLLLPPDIGYSLITADILPAWQNERSPDLSGSAIIFDKLPGDSAVQVTLPDQLFQAGASSVTMSIAAPDGKTDICALKKRDENKLQFSDPPNLPAGYYTYSLVVKNDQNNSLSASRTLPAGSPESIPDFSRPAFSAMYDYDVKVLTSITEGDVRRARREAESIKDEIDEEAERIRDNQAENDQLTDSLRRVRNRKYELQRIDRILEGIPSAYRWRIKEMLDSLDRVIARQGRVPDTTALQNAIDKARQRLDDCLDHVAGLKQRQVDLENERDKLKEEQDALLKQIHSLFTENGWNGNFGYHENGRYWFGYVGDENTGNFYGQKYYNEVLDIRKELRKKNRKYQDILKEVEDLPREITEAENECEHLAGALEEALRKKAEGIAYTEAEAQIEEYCRQIRSLIDLLREWCEDNPGPCANLSPRLEELLIHCPASREGWEDFFKDLDRVINMKKVAESELGEQEEDIEDAINENDQEIDEAEESIAGLEDNYDDAAREADRLQRELDAARAAAAAEARERERQEARERAQREAKRKRLEDLVRRARQGGDPGEEALKKLIQETGLGILDEVSGDLKIGKMIGGLITLANMPDCVCPLLENLKNALAASRRGADTEVWLYTNEYIRAWKDCASLPSISSVMEGSTQLADAISDMSNAQLDRGMEALSRAIELSNCR